MIENLANSSNIKWINYNKIAFISKINYFSISSFAKNKNMKSFTTLFTFILFCSFIKIQDNEKKLPSVTVRSTDGKNVNVSAFSNDSKPILLLVLEVTCKPCLTEFDNIS